MVGSVSSSTQQQTLSVPSTVKTEDVGTQLEKTLKDADRALYLVLQDEQMIGSLAGASTKWTPPTRGLIKSFLWGLLNDKGSVTIEKSELTDVVRRHGGSTVEADALWLHLNPKGKSQVDAGDFAANIFINQAIDANIEDIHEAVDETRKDTQLQKSGTILDFFSGTGDSIFDYLV